MRTTTPVYEIKRDGCKRHCGEHPSCCRAQRLFSLGDRVALIDPVRAKIVGNIKDFCVRESHGMQGVVGRLHVGTVRPGTAAAIEDDELGSREGLDSLAALLQSRLAR